MRPPRGRFFRSLGRSAASVIDNEVHQRNACLGTAEERSAEIQSSDPTTTLQMDCLSSLPTDVLRHLCRILSDDRKCLTPGYYSNEVLTDILWEGSGNTAALLALRSCCKRLASASDDVRTSIAFLAEKQRDAEKFICKLPQLDTVAVHFHAKSRNIGESLASLHRIQPGLTALALCYQGFVRHGAVPSKMDADLRRDLADWSGSSTLLSLVLTRINCDQSRRATSCGLYFLPQLPALQVLELRDVSPVLRSQDITYCTGLTKLTLQGNADTPDITLIFPALNALQSLNVTNYGVRDLHLWGLDRLTSLECSNNSLSHLMFEQCPALEIIKCSNNLLGRLDMASNPALRILVCHENPITNLQVTGCSYLEQLFCSNCNITQLDLSTCPNLHTLRCAGLRVRSLDLQACAKLVELTAPNMTALMFLDLYGLTQLETVTLGSLTDEGSRITSLHIDGCTTLACVKCDNCHSLNTLHSSGCKSLSRVSVYLGNLRLIYLIRCIPFRTFDCSACHQPGVVRGPLILLGDNFCQPQQPKRDKRNGLAWVLQMFGSQLVTEVVKYVP